MQPARIRPQLSSGSVSIKSHSLNDTQTPSPIPTPSPKWDEFVLGGGLGLLFDPSLWGAAVKSEGVGTPRLRGPKKVEFCLPLYPSHP